jgi:hypothetical protein
MYVWHYLNMVDMRRVIVAAIPRALDRVMGLGFFFPCFPWFPLPLGLLMAVDLRVWVLRLLRTRAVRPLDDVVAAEGV